MSFKMVRAKELFCTSLFLFRHYILDNIDDISGNLLKYSFYIARCCDEIDAINEDS